MKLHQVIAIYVIVALLGLLVGMCGAAAQVKDLKAPELARRESIVSKLDAGAEITADEWKEYVAVLDAEVKARGGITLLADKPMKPQINELFAKSSLTK